MQEQLPTRLQRVLTVLSFIQSGVRLNAGNLANDLGVSRRTIFRDVNLLRDAGIPIFFDEEWDSYRIDPNYRMPRLGTFSDKEIALLVLAAQTSSLNDSPELGSVIRQAVLRLTSALAAESKEAAAAVVDNCTYLRSNASINPDVVAACLQGMKQQRNLLLHMMETHVGPPIYLAPWHLVASSDAWLVVGHVTPLDRNCRLDLKSVRQAVVTERQFERPRHLNVSSTLIDFPDFAGLRTAHGET
jgi:hypothetical protein